MNTCFWCDKEYVEEASTAEDKITFCSKECETTVEEEISKNETRQAIIDDFKKDARAARYNSAVETSKDKINEDVKTEIPEFYSKEKYEGKEVNKMALEKTNTPEEDIDELLDELGEDFDEDFEEEISRHGEDEEYDEPDPIDSNDEEEPRVD